MSAARKHARAGHERWLVSYADFITLLFAFFVVLYAVSKSEHLKEGEVSASINHALTDLSAASQIRRKMGLEEMNSASPAEPSPPVETRVLSPAGAQDELETVRARLAQALGPQLAANAVSLRMDPNGLVISLREAGFFQSGTADPLPESASVLRTVGEALTKAPYEVRVEGHTDNMPIHNEKFASNWELSSARAIRIARQLIAMRMIVPERLSAAGYGEFHPVASNETAAGRAANRRVDLVVYPRVQLNAAARGSVSASGGWQRITEDGSGGPQ